MNLINRPAQVTLCNNSGTASACIGGGSIVAQTQYSYDSYSSSCPGGGLKSVPGIVNHDDANFGGGYTARGNPTQIQRWVSTTGSPLTKSLCYDTTGQVLRETDFNGNYTTYDYTDKFYLDDGGNPPSTYPPLSSPTNAYVKTVTNAANQSNTFGYYYGSGNSALWTDPNMATSYFHYRDPFDRDTETDYPVGWTKTVYASAVEGDVYVGVNDATASQCCANDQHKQVLLDSWGRESSERLMNAPPGQLNVDTVYDSSSRAHTVSHPYIQGAGAVNETYSYDGLNRATQTMHPDGQALLTFYGTSVTGVGANGVANQQRAPAIYGYGYPILAVDEDGRQRQQWLDGFGRIIEVDEPSTAATPGEGSVSISGSEQSVLVCHRWLQGGDCQQWITKYDTGTVSITVNGHPDSVTYGSTSTPASIASALSSAINGDSGAPVTASASGSTVSLISKATGSATNYSLSASSSTNDPTDFGTASFWPTTSGSALTGGQTNGSSLASPTATFYTYDAADRLTSVTQGLQTRNYYYDGLGRPTKIITPEAGTDQYFYTVSGGGLCSGDPGNVCQRTDARGITSTYTYDALNRVTGITYSDGTGAVSFLYDQGGAAAYAIGRRTGMTDSTGSETYSYDAGGRITQLQKTIGGATFTTAYAYNAAGEVTQITYPSGRVVQYAYSPAGWLCEVAGSTTSCGSSSNSYASIPNSSSGYNAAGQLLSLNYGNGVAGTFTYSGNRSQLASLAYAKGSTTYFSLAYSYQQGSGCAVGAPGNNGQVQCIVDNTPDSVTLGAAGRSMSYTYDALGRLATAASQGSTQFSLCALAMSYDRYGNRSSEGVTQGNNCPNNSLSFATNGGALTNHPDGWCFDGSGNVLAKTNSPCPPNAPTYAWDAENRLVAYGASATYAYDGDGIRVQKNANGTSTVFIWSGSRDIAEYDFTPPQQPNPGSPSREFVYADGLPGNGLVASITGGQASTTLYFHDDHLDWRVSTDVNGNLAGQQGHWPFGESWYSTNGNEFVFTSYQRDGESGLDFALARYYDSTAARFCSADPLGGQPGDPQSWNRYSYSRNDPVNLVDPSGKGFLSWLLDIFAVLFAIFSGGAGSPASAAILGSTITVDGVDLTAILADVAASAAAGARIGEQAGQGQQPQQPQQQQTQQGSSKSPCLGAGVQAALAEALAAAANQSLGTNLSGSRTTDPFSGLPTAPGGGVTVDLQVPQGGVPIDPSVLKNAGSPFPGFHAGYSSDIRTDTPLPGPSTSAHVVFNTTVQDGQVLLTAAQVHGDIGNPNRDVAGFFKHIWKDVIRAPRISKNNGGCPIKFTGN